MIRQHKQKKEPTIDQQSERYANADIADDDEDCNEDVSGVFKVVAEAAAKIGTADLNTFLVKNSEMLLIRFADYFESAFSSVSSAQFPLMELVKENSVAQITNILMYKISKDVHNESKNWIIHQPTEALGSFVLWSLDCICEDLESQQTSSENSKMVVQDVTSSKSKVTVLIVLMYAFANNIKNLQKFMGKVGIFMALAIVLRQSPYALVNVLPTLREASKYQGQDKLILVAWMVEQVSLGDLAVGLYSWAHNLLPIVNGKSSNPQSRDIILHIVEQILSHSEDHSALDDQFALDNGTIRNGERLIPPFALEILIRVTFPLPSARTEATERFERIYTTLKNVALAGSNPMKEEALQILSFAIEAARESKNVQLSNEGASICTWCLTQNPKCYKLWHGRKPKPVDSSSTIEEQFEECTCRLAEMQRAAIVDAPVRSRHQSVDDEDEDGSDNVDEAKQKKPEKPKVTIAEVASEIDAAGLAAFMVKSSEIQLMRFVDYFVRAFSAVSSTEFPWVKLFREYSVAKMTDIPLSYISVDVCKASIDWINRQSVKALGSFVIWSLDCIFADLANQQASSKNSENVGQDVSSKSQVGIFVSLALVLRGSPYALVDILPMLRETSEYRGQDMLVVVAWMIAQVSLRDLAVGLYSWAHNLLPFVNGNNSNEDNILQIVEIILSTPNALPILERNAIINGERLIPPAALEILIRVAFPPFSARKKATKRFEAIYPTLKKVALAASYERLSMEEVALQILSFATEAAGESENVRLSNEAASICTWCMIHEECYKLWDTIYLENPEASIAILKNMYLDKMYPDVGMPMYALRVTFKNFRQKNEAAIASGGNVALFKEADRYCKVIMRRSYREDFWLIGMLTFPTLLIAVIAALFEKYVDMKSR